MAFYEFLSDFSDFQKLIKHHQITSTPKTFRKLAWNHLTMFWLNFVKNRRFLLLTIERSTCSRDLFSVFVIVPAFNDLPTNHCLQEVLCGLFQKLLTTLSEVVIQPLRTSQTCKRWTLSPIKNSSSLLDFESDFHLVVLEQNMKEMGTYRFDWIFKKQL